MLRNANQGGWKCSLIILGWHTFALNHFPVVPCGRLFVVLWHFVVLHPKVARKLVIIEGDLERTEERAELSERYDLPPDLAPAL